MIVCMMPGCKQEGTRLHSHEDEGSDCLICEGHHALLFQGGGPGEEDLNAYNRAYNAVLEARRRAAEVAASAPKEDEGDGEAF